MNIKKHKLACNDRDILDIWIYIDPYVTLQTFQLQGIHSSIHKYVVVYLS